MMMKSLKLIGNIFVILIISSFFVNAEDMTGKKLAQSVFNRDRGMNSISTAQMVLINKNGNKRKRLFTNKRLMEGDLERQITRFTSPADIDGTGFLTIEKPRWKTEQFLYLPALRRSRRIVSSQKSQRFVNSDFTYEDMERQAVDNYAYKIVGSKPVGNLDCYVLETRPHKGIDTQYSLTYSLISKQSRIPLFVKYYDKKGNHFKTYKVLKLEQIQGVWTELNTSMENLEKGHKTYIKLEKIIYNTDIDQDQISKKSLENY
jgi:hypothetical protein